MGYSGSLSAIQNIGVTGTDEGAQIYDSSGLLHQLINTAKMQEMRISARKLKTGDDIK